MGTARLVTKYYAPGAFPSGGTVVSRWSAVTALTELRSTGQLTLVIPNTCPVQPADGGMLSVDITDGESTERVLAALCQKKSRKTIAREGAKQQRTTWQCPGHLAIYKKGRIGPPMGAGSSPRVDSFTYNYTHKDYDDSGWDNATEIDTVENAQGIWDDDGTNITPPTWPVGWARDMPQHAVLGVGSGTTMILWASDGTTSNAAVGKCVFREEITATYTGAHILFFTADNVGKVFIDGAHIATAGSGGNVTDSGFVHTVVVSFTMTAGPHVIAIEADNFPLPAGGFNPGGVAAAIYTPGYPPTLVWETTSSMKIMEYVDELPGMTLGHVLRLMTEEQVDYGKSWAADIDLSEFDDFTDANGDDWADELNISVSVGRDSCLSVISKAQQVYGDIKMDPSSWKLLPVNWGSRSASSGVVIEAGENIGELTHNTESAVADEVLMLSDNVGWVYDGGGESTEFLEIGVELTLTEAYRFGDRMIAIYGLLREETSLVYLPQRGVPATEAVLFSDSFDRDGPAWSASSTVTSNGTNTPALAIDNQDTTFWQPVAGVTNPELIIDRGSSLYATNAVRVLSHGNLGGATFYPIDYTIDTSTNGSVWTTRATVTGNSTIDRIVTYASTTDRYVRIRVTARQSDGADPFAHLALMEFQPLEPLGSTDSAYGGTAATWIEQSGAWRTARQKATEITGGGGQFTAVIETGRSDGTVEGTFLDFQDGGLSWRATNDNNYWLCNNQNIFKRVAGSFSAAGSAFSIALGRTLSGQDRVRVVLSGNTMNLYAQLGAVGPWILACTVTDSFNATATKHGLRSDGGSPFGDSFDRFTFTGLTDPTPSQYPFLVTDFVEGSYVTVPDENLEPVTTERAMAITLTQSDQDENVRVGLVVKDRITDFNERVVTELTTR